METRKLTANLSLFLAPSLILSKSETFKKAKLSIKTDIRENNNVYNRWSPFSDEMDIGTYSISEGFVKDTVLQHSMSVIIPLTFVSA